MNETNILAGTEVLEVQKDFSDVYLMQLSLQEKLNQIPMDTTDFKHMANKSIYWYFCIQAEAQELLEWLAQDTNPSWIKEMQFEAIDILHFALNIGIEAGYTANDILAIEKDYEHSDWLIAPDRVQAALNILNTTCITFINQLPFKTWKKYKTKPDTDLLYDSYTNILRATLMLCNACNLNQQKTINMYFAKNKVNFQRQSNGY